MDDTRYYYYQCIHFPTGKHFIKRVLVDEHPSQHEFIRFVMDMNRSNPGVWQYWCNTAEPIKNPRWFYDEVKTLSDGDTALVGAA